MRCERIGFVFQHYNLLPSLRAWENVALALELRGQTGAPIEKASRGILERLGLERRADAYPEELSGGEKQRVAIARAVVGGPDIVLADEPTAALDAASGSQVAQLLADIAHENGCAVVIVTHDSRITGIADRLAYLDDGALLWVRKSIHLQKQSLQESGFHEENVSHETKGHSPRKLDGSFVRRATLLLADWTRSEQLAAAAASPVVNDRLVAAGGLVEPASEARELAAPVVGRIVKMNYEEGDHVAAGDVIAEIENDDLKAQLAGAGAALIARGNELVRLKAGAREQEISAARAELREADAVAAMARSAFERRTALAAKQIVSQEALDQARTDRDTAEARRALMAERLSSWSRPRVRRMSRSHNPIWMPPGHISSRPRRKSKRRSCALRSTASS